MRSAAEAKTVYYTTVFIALWTPELYYTVVSLRPVFGCVAVNVAMHLLLCVGPPLRRVFGCVGVDVAMHFLRYYAWVRLFGLSDVLG